MFSQKTNKIIFTALSTSRFALYTAEGIPIHLLKNLMEVYKKPNPKMERK